MLFGKYHFLCRLQSDAVLPYFKGSTFRGVFGQALKKVVCALKQETCEVCLLRERCVYSFVFETPYSLKDNRDARLAAPPHPFVIEPPLTTETHFPKDTSFDFHLLLFGDANQSLPYFIYAFEQMGKIGIGKRINGKRGLFRLEKVKSRGHLVYSSADQRLKRDDSSENLLIRIKEAYPQGPFQLKLKLLTPLRVKFQNRLRAELPFHILVRSMLRRLSSLYNYYGEGEPPLDYKGLVKRAEEVRIMESHLTWFDWRRYSNRQDRAMLMGGMIGSIIYEGKMGEYMPILEFCSEVHIGKQTSFGLGKIKAEIDC